MPVRAFPGRILVELGVSCAVTESVAGCNDWIVMVEVFVPDRMDQRKGKVVDWVAVDVRPDSQNNIHDLNYRSQLILCVSAGGRMCCAFVTVV